MRVVEFCGDQVVQAGFDRRFVVQSDDGGDSFSIGSWLRGGAVYLVVEAHVSCPLCIAEEECREAFDGDDKDDWGARGG